MVPLSSLVPTSQLSLHPLCRRGLHFVLQVANGVHVPQGRNAVCANSTFLHAPLWQARNEHASEGTARSRSVAVTQPLSDLKMSSLSFKPLRHDGSCFLFPSSQPLLILVMPATHYYPSTPPSILQVAPFSQENRNRVLVDMMGDPGRAALINRALLAQRKTASDMLFLLEAGTVPAATRCYLPPRSVHVFGDPSTHLASDESSSDCALPPLPPRPACNPHNRTRRAPSPAPPSKFSRPSPCPSPPRAPTRRGSSRRTAPRAASAPCLLPSPSPACCSRGTPCCRTP